MSNSGNTKTIRYTYRFRLYSTKDQIYRLSKSFGSVRYVYNYFLSEEKDNYKLNHTHLGYYANAKALTELKKEYVSHSYNRQRIKVARLQEKIANSRKDYLHKITSNLVKQYDTICIEDLDNVSPPMTVEEPIFFYSGEWAKKSEATKSLV